MKEHKLREEACICPNIAAKARCYRWEENNKAGHGMFKDMKLCCVKQIWCRVQLSVVNEVNFGSFLMAFCTNSTGFYSSLPVQGDKMTARHIWTRHTAELFYLWDSLLCLVIYIIQLRPNECRRTGETRSRQEMREQVTVDWNRIGQRTGQYITEQSNTDANKTRLPGGKQERRTGTGLRSSLWHS